MVQITCHYFDTLFRSSNPFDRDLAKVCEGVQAKLSNQSSNFLNSIFTREEDCIGSSVIKACLRVLNDRELRRRKRKKGSMTIKLDMSKAYDWVEWKFSEGMIQKMGFSIRWVKLVLLSKFRGYVLDSGGEAILSRGRCIGALGNICKPKCEGGLVFQDLESSNRAFLAKQEWRILKNPESLVARVLKGCYFKDCNFMEAKKNSSISYVWSSIL
ncbi:hypothetical protein Ddye_001593 [Dipteronia dyeriana]|uniref:Reverse transcriptase n=1 Tax=Dipteronia dyeriana TaxID=168575 RepID=A0AAD9XNY3_9ROSI|nr:hypothetical protein Ddye_001593 [Dipteronia dyeriana]